MKAKLEFNLDDWSDRFAHKRCVNATDAYIALFNISNCITELWDICEPNSELERIIHKINAAMEDIDLGDLE